MTCSAIALAVLSPVLSAMALGALSRELAAVRERRRSREWGASEEGRWCEAVMARALCEVREDVGRAVARWRRGGSGR